MLPVLDQLLGTFFELLKNMYLTWIASVDKKVGDFRKLGVVDSAKFAYSRRFALVPCTVYLVLIQKDFETKMKTHGVFFELWSLDR